MEKNENKSYSCSRSRLNQAGMSTCKPILKKKMTLHKLNKMVGEHKREG